MPNNKGEGKSSPIPTEVAQKLKEITKKHGYDTSKLKFKRVQRKVIPLKNG